MGVLHGVGWGWLSASSNSRMLRLFKWQQQLERWARGVLPVRVCAGLNSSLPVLDRPGVCLTTYATVMDCRHRLDGSGWAVLLLDEAHHMSLCPPDRLQSVLSLEANHTVVLTPHDVTAHLPAYLLTLMAARDPYVVAYFPCVVRSVTCMTHIEPVQGAVPAAAGGLQGGGRLGRTGERPGQRRRAHGSEYPQAHQARRQGRVSTAYTRIAIQYVTSSLPSNSNWIIVC